MRESDLGRSRQGSISWCPGRAVGGGALIAFGAKIWRLLLGGNSRLPLQQFLL